MMIKPKYEYVNMSYICENCAIKKNLNFSINYETASISGLCGHCKSNKPTELIKISNLNKGGKNESK